MSVGQNTEYFKSTELYAEEDLNNQINEFLEREGINDLQIIDKEFNRFSHAHNVWWEAELTYQTW